MLKLAVGSFLAAWAVLGLITVTGNLAWDNRAMWLPLILLGIACFLGLGGWSDEEQRVPRILLGIVSFACMLLYFVFYLFVFAYSGY